MEKLTLQFDKDEINLIELYQKEAGATSLKNAILNAISIGIDHEDYIVRCRFCRWGEPESDDVIYCSCPYHQIDSAVHGEWFCADGIRRDESHG